MLHFSCKQKKLEQDKEVSSTNLGQTRGQQVVIMKFLWSTERERASHFLCLKSNSERFIKKTQSGTEDRNVWIPFGRKLTFRVFPERLSWSRAHATCASACPSPGSAWVIDQSCFFYIYECICRGSLAMPITSIHQNFMSRNLPFEKGWHWAGAFRDPSSEVSIVCYFPHHSFL